MKRDLTNSPIFVADIGGTNARFGIAENGVVSKEKVYKVSDFNHPRDAITKYLQEVQQQPDRACLAVACPVHTHPIQLTNSHWQFYRTKLQQELGLSQLKIINDFTALSLAVPLLKPDDYIKFGSGKVAKDSPIGVLGPGTGLGMSGLIWARAQNAWIPLQGEGGHISFAPQTEREILVAEILRSELPRISAERVLTGKGLQRLYHALCTINGQPIENFNEQKIAELAINKKNESCMEAMDMFACALGDVAGDLGLVLGAFGGVYIGGGIVSKHHKYFINSSLRRRFENKGRFDSYMREIPTFIIKSDLSALKGCAVAMDEE